MPNKEWYDYALDVVEAVVKILKGGN